MKCNLCNSENLMESLKESRLIPGVKYVTCKSCGNVMILSNGVLIPTPQTNDKMTQAMIEDAAIAFSENGKLMAASLTGKNYENEIQPTTVQDLMQDYVNNFINSMNELEEDICDFDDCNYEDCDCEDYIDFDDFDESEENYDYLETVHEAEVDKELSLETASTLRTDNNNYLVILPSGEKRMFRNCSKQFLLNIINTIGTHVEVFELKEIELKQEVRYSF